MIREYLTLISHTYTIGGDVLQALAYGVLIN